MAAIAPRWRPWLQSMMAARAPRWPPRPPATRCRVRGRVHALDHGSNGLGPECGLSRIVLVPIGPGLCFTGGENEAKFPCIFLIHLSQTGELIGYPWSGVRRPPLAPVIALRVRKCEALRYWSLGTRTIRRFCIFFNTWLAGSEGMPCLALYNVQSYSVPRG